MTAPIRSRRRPGELEHEVAHFAGYGWSDARIAAALKVSVWTVACVRRRLAGREENHSAGTGAAA